MKRVFTPCIVLVEMLNRQRVLVAVPVFFHADMRVVSVGNGRKRGFSHLIWDFRFNQFNDLERKKRCREEGNRDRIINTTKCVDCQGAIQTRKVGV